MIADEFQLILDEASENIEKSLGHLSTELKTIRAGRATPSMLDNVVVDYYGSKSPINQVASISAPSPDMLMVAPWDKSALPEIEKAINAANLGINPSNDGEMIRIPVPPLSEERRRELVKSARSKGEETKVAVRNIRRSAKDEIKKAEKAHSLPEDMRYESEEQLQKLTDGSIERIDKALDRKESEIMEV